jgi:pimeloyl-ACP methyl ester carboxylesterase
VSTTASAAISADGIPIQFTTAGSGSPALVLVHGWSCDRTYWASQVEAFAATNRVVAMDLAGHGASGAGRPEWTMQAFGDDVAAVMEAADVRDAVLVGHSMGGDIVVEAALAVPDRVRALIWVDDYRSLENLRTFEEARAFAEPYRDDFFAKAAAFVRGMFLPTSDPDLVERVATAMASAPPEIAVEVMTHALGNPQALIAGLARLTVPVFAINPSEWPVNAESLARHGIRNVPLAGVGHFPMLEDPAGFNRALAEVIRELR